jgi:hypothetical protein
MKNKHACQIAPGLRNLLARAFLAVVASCVLYSSLAYAGWTRGRTIGTSAAGEVPFEPFVLTVWGSDDTNDANVTGLCRYHNVTSGRFEIDGQETSSGEFYPDVLYQISNGDGDWETLKTPVLDRGKRVTIVVEPGATSRPLKVDLAIFLPLIGKAKYGSLVLMMGERASFLIDDLQPPSSGPRDR